MGKYVFAYTGGSMSSTPEEAEAATKAWMGWFGELGSAVVDAGAPFGTSTAIKGDAPKSGLSGYSVIQAADLQAAADLAKGCPVFASGGDVEVFEALDVM